MEKMKQNLLQGRYEEAAKICQNMDKDQARDMLMTIAYDTESICVYSFALYMIKKTEQTSWTELAIELMVHPFCYIEGAYSAALSHARELLSAARSVENLEQILFFHEIPEKLVGEDEAKHIAEEIIKTEPENEIAREVLDGCR